MKISWSVLLVSAAYATLRYNVFQHVSWNDWPAYTMNKAFAVSALALLAVAVVLKGGTRRRIDPLVLQAAGVFALIHVVLSLTMLSPAYFEKFFVNGRFTPEAGWSIALGAVAAAGMTMGAAKSFGQNGESRIAPLAIIAGLTGLHAALQGFSGWFAPGAWPGMMPPITLISFLLALVAAAAAMRPKPRHM